MKSIKKLVNKINEIMIDWLENNKLKIQVAFIRLVRGFITGAVSSALTIGVFTGTSLNQLGEWLVVLFLAGTTGGIGGLLLAIDKIVRWKDVQK